jgi:hypothetical protein
MAEPQDRPLWEVMERAYPSPENIRVPSIENLSRQIYAAEIRAIADVVGRRGALGLDLDPGETADWLRAEADRAEGRGANG